MTKLKNEERIRISSNINHDIKKHYFLNKLYFCLFQKQWQVKETEVEDN